MGTRSGVLGFCLAFTALSVANAAADVRRTESAAEEVPPGIFWLKTYAVRDFGAFWHVDLDVKDGADARKKILALMKKRGAFPQQPIENLPVTRDFSYQQFSFRIRRSDAQAALKKLEKIGKLVKLQQKENPLPDMNDDVKIKLKKLEEERQTGRAELAQLPSIAAVIDELLNNLQTAYVAYQDSADRILLNIVVVGPKRE